MRLKLSLLFAGTLAAGVAAIAVSAPSATATQRILCEDGVGAVVTVGDRELGGCIPKEPPCDPGPCTPPATARPPR